mmetsp:Transcript_17719/g.33361  ORF Transcript_17719/g.33361 Transcript_17719/m.33361 type:complete len:369 (+) Transcript_17719:565-1671(+)
MTLPDIALLQTGYLFFQPGNGEQQPVVICDFSRARRVAEEAKGMGCDESLMTQRVALYCCTVFPDEDSQTRGAVLLYPVSSNGLCILEFRPALWNFVRHAAPIKLTKLLVAQSYEPEKHLLVEFLRLQIATVIGFNSRFSPNQICADSVAQTARQLEDFGVRRHVAPFCLGGTVDYDARIANWTRMRISMESMFDTPASLPRAGMIKAFSPAKRKKRDNDIPEEDFNRKRNALYSRRMYHKRKLALLSVKEEVNIWENRNEAARKEQGRLLGLVEEARKVLSANGVQLVYSMGGFDHSIHPCRQIAYQPIVPQQPIATQHTHHLANNFGMPASLEPPPYAMTANFGNGMFGSDVADISFENLDEIMFP